MFPGIQPAPGAAYARITQVGIPDTPAPERMVTALMLLCVEGGRISAVAEEVATIPGVTEAYSVAGRYDLAVVIRVKESEQLASGVTDRIRMMASVQQSETLIAFHVHSNYNVESVRRAGEEAPR